APGLDHGGQRHAMTGLLPVLSRLENVFVAIEHGVLFQAATGRIRLRCCTGGAEDSADISPSMELKLCTGRNSSTCGSIILMPCALASKPPKRNSGLSQIRRRQDRCSRSISNASLASASRSSPSEIKSTIAPCPSTRLPHNLLKVCSELAMRVPPAQSSTVEEQLASAWSGSRARSARVTLVSLVPNRNTDTRLRASVMACRKCRNNRVYSLIEPEISSSATIGAGLSIRPSRWISLISPPVRRLARRVRRMSRRRTRG